MAKFLIHESTTKSSASVTVCVETQLVLLGNKHNRFPTSLLYSVRVINSILIK